MTTVSVTDSRYAGRVEYFARYRKERKEEKRQWLDFYEHHIERYLENLPPRKAKKSVAVRSFDATRYAIGFNPLIMNRKTGEVNKMPPEFALIFKACEELIDNKRRFPSLYEHGGEAMNNRKVRILMAKVLAVMLSNADFYHGRVGMPTAAGMDTISYDYLMQNYVLRWGEIISPKTMGKCVKRLELSGLLYTKPVYVQIDTESEKKYQDNATYNNEERTYEVRSAASYKQFTMQFIQELKVTLYKNVMSMLKKTRDSKLAKGLSFDWIGYKTLGDKLRKALDAYRLNDVTKQLALGITVPPDDFHRFPI
ncbi:hypothetical protein AB9X29_003778 [Vibrio vulnificus]